MKDAVKKLLLVLPLRQEEDLVAGAAAEGWQDMNEFYQKTRTAYAIHWSGNYVLDQDEIPWKASKEEVSALERIRGRVIVLAGWKYNISDVLTLHVDKDGSVYAVETDLEGFFE